MKKRPSIAVVLNAFQRTEVLARQVAAVEAQTLPCAEILVWSNTFKPNLVLESPRLSWAMSNVNHGVWSRFAYALNVKSEFTCLLDDDTIPGRRWLENCISTMRVSEGLLGTRGLRFNPAFGYRGSEDIGWKNPNPETVQVDIVGHSWFFRTAWLAQFWGGLGDRYPSDLAGEDIHFSYVLKKELGLGTFVPPHPEDDKELWGSLPEYGDLLGEDAHALSKHHKAPKRFVDALEHYRSRGFVLVEESSKTKRPQNPRTQVDKKFTYPRPLVSLGRSLLYLLFRISRTLRR